MMTRRFLLLLTLSLWWVSAYPGGWGAHWVSHPLPDTVSQVWFRKRVKTPVALRKAFVTIASSGYLRLYVNERNVAIDPFLNYADSLPGVIRQYTFDVTRFLDDRENVIAVWYAPRPGRHSDRQLSLDFYGEDMLGKRFFVQADGTWQCRNACARSNAEGGEEVDGRAYDPAWRSADEPLDGWTRPVDSGDTAAVSLFDTSPVYEGVKVVRVLNAVDTREDGRGVTYDFGRTFRGWVRITLRNARKGERITFGPHSYICGARMDEQAFPRFTVTDQRFVTITGDEAFDRGQIQSVEGLEIDGYRHTHYMY